MTARRAPSRTNPAKEASHMAAAETLTHIERFDANGKPTGCAQCGAEDGWFATATWWADCEACIDSDDDARDETEQ